MPVKGMSIKCDGRFSTNASRPIKEKSDEKTIVSRFIATTWRRGSEIGRFLPRLRDKNAHFPVAININLLNHTLPILTLLVSVLVSANQTESRCRQSVSWL